MNLRVATLRNLPDSTDLANMGSFHRCSCHLYDSRAVLANQGGFNALLGRLHDVNPHLIGKLAAVQKPYGFILYSSRTTSAANPVR